MKLKNSFTAEETIIRVNIKPIDERKFYSTSDKKIISRIYIYIYFIHLQSPKLSINKWFNELNRWLSKE